MEVSEIQLHTVHNISDWKRYCGAVPQSGYQLGYGCKWVRRWLRVYW